MNQVAPTPASSAQNEEKTIYNIAPEMPGGGKVYQIVKRTFDFLFSLLALLIFFLPMLIIAIAIKSDSKGPVFFTQDRVGKNGKSFAVYKFRTMVVNAEAAGPQWASKDDDRCTKVGKFLRKTRLDEMPQFLNILFGHMSIVAPRPEREFFYEQFETYIHGFRNRLAVTPGLTGLAQVNGGYNLTPEEKVVYDMQYIKDQSLLLDLKLIFQTVKLVFTHEGAR